MFSPFFLHCFCSFSVSPPFSFLFFCSFFLWVLLFFFCPSSLYCFFVFSPLFLLCFCSFSVSPPSYFLFLCSLFPLGSSIFFSIPLLSPLFLRVFALFPPLFLFFFCQPTLFFFVFGSFSSFYSQRMSCVFLDNEDIQDRYYRSNGNGWRWQGYLLFFD